LGLLALILKTSLRLTVFHYLADIILIIFPMIHLRLFFILQAQLSILFLLVLVFLRTVPLLTLFVFPTPTTPQFYLCMAKLR